MGKEKSIYRTGCPDNASKHRRASTGQQNNHFPGMRVRTGSSRKRWEKAAGRDGSYRRLLMKIGHGRKSKSLPFSGTALDFAMKPSGENIPA